MLSALSSLAGFHVSTKRPDPKTIAAPFGDYIIVFNDLYHASNLNLPSAIIAHILDFCQYMPESHASREQECSGRDNDDSVYLRAPMMKYDLFRPISIRISVSSRDQGWSSYPEFHGTRQGSWSWTEFSLSTSIFPYIYSSRNRLFTNIHAGREIETQTQVFFEGSKIFDSVNDAYTALKPGECFYMLIWSRSAYPGWKNRIQRAKITIAWECNDFDKLVSYSDRIKTIHRA